MTADSSAQTKPAFLITIDTEGDNGWARRPETSVANAEHLPRFQSLCERYGLKPTYLTTWEMANSPAFQEFGRALLQRKAGEIGMHLHPWNSPPVIPLTEADHRYLPFATDYPERALRDKVAVLTDNLEETFQVKMVSHRAGRWGFDATYARALAEFGYRVDCSVTPYVSWASVKGAPGGRGGPDFTGFPRAAYFMDLGDVSRPGDSPLLEVPVTILAPSSSPARRIAGGCLARVPFGRRLARRLMPGPRWLRPDGRNRGSLLGILAAARRERRDYVEFMLHSSELMPGGSPYFPTHRSVERLYADLEALFDAAAQAFAGITLAQLYDRLIVGRTTLSRTG